jgi:tRNA-dihydrouridine synthase B
LKETVEPPVAGFHIGEFHFATPLVLAPMAGVTDRVFRDLCRQQGAAYTIGEMVASQKQLWHSAKSSTRRADRSEAEPRAIQLLGTEPQLLAEAARWQVDHGAQIIDLNFGCPAKKVCSVAAGSALMAYPQKAAEIFSAVVQAVPLTPVTVKIRTGTDPEHRNALEVAKMAEDCGLQAIAIHGRTRADKFQGEAEYDTIAEVKQALSIPVMANGDITSPEQALFVLKYTSADAVMIGRASLGNPWIFRAINQALHQQTPDPLTLEEFFQGVVRHISGLHALYGEITGVRHARKHVGWYLERLARTLKQEPVRAFSSQDEVDALVRKMRQTFNRLETPQQQLDVIHAYAQNHLQLEPTSQPDPGAVL